jgi:hypothetical protein
MEWIGVLLPLYKHIRAQRRPSPAPIHLRDDLQNVAVQQRLKRHAIASINASTAYLYLVLVHHRPAMIREMDVIFREFIVPTARFYIKLSKVTYEGQCAVVSGERSNELQRALDRLLNELEERVVHYM